MEPIPVAKSDLESVNNSAYDKDSGIFAKLKRILCCRKKKAISNDWIHKTQDELKKEYPEAEQETVWDEKTSEDEDTKARDRGEGKIEHKLTK